MGIAVVGRADSPTIVEGLAILFLGPDVVAVGPVPHLQQLHRRLGVGAVPPVVKVHPAWVVKLAHCLWMLRHPGVKVRQRGGIVAGGAGCGGVAAHRVAHGIEDVDVPLGTLGVLGATHGDEGAVHGVAVRLGQCVCPLGVVHAVGVVGDGHELQAARLPSGKGGVRG